MRDLLDTIFQVNTKQEKPLKTELVSLEQELGIQLPQSYRDFMNAFGVGYYCDHIRIHSPKEVLSMYSQRNTTFLQNYYDKNNTLPYQDLAQTITLAETIDGDHIVSVPTRSDTLFVLPRNDNKIYYAPYGLYAPEIWTNGKETLQKGNVFRFFTSWRDRKQTWIETENKDVTKDVLVSVITQLPFCKITHTIHKESPEIRSTILFISALEGKLTFSTERLADGTWSKYIMIDYDVDREEYVEQIKHQLALKGIA